MEKLSVTQQIIIYCKANPNTLFDVELMFGNVFQCSDFDSFRKYVSRAKEPGGLHEIGKGVYYIGKNPAEEEIQKAMVDFYVDNNYGMLSGLSLLYKYKLIEDAPSYIEIKCSVKRNKAIGDNKIIPTANLEMSIRIARNSIGTEGMRVIPPIATSMPIMARMQTRRRRYRCTR